MLSQVLCFLHVHCCVVFFQSCPCLGLCREKNIGHVLVFRSFVACVMLMPSPDCRAGNIFLFLHFLGPAHMQIITINVAACRMMTMTISATTVPRVVEPRSASGWTDGAGMVGMASEGVAVEGVAYEGTGVGGSVAASLTRVSFSKVTLKVNV